MTYVTHMCYLRGKNGDRPVSSQPAQTQHPRPAGRTYGREKRGVPVCFSRIQPKAAHAVEGCFIFGAAPWAGG